MEERKKNKITDDKVAGELETDTAEDRETAESAGNGAPETKVKRTRKPKKSKEENLKDNITQKIQLGTHRMLSTTERIIQGLSNAYENIFIGKEDVKKDFEKEQGIKFYNKGNYERALEHFDAYLQDVDGQDADVLYLMAMCQVHQGDHKAAAVDLKKAEKLSPEDEDIIMESAKCLFALENYSEALAYLKKATAIIPDDADVYYHLGTCYEKLDQIEDAKKNYKKAIDLSPREAVYYHALGFVYENSGNHKDAIVCFKKAMDLEREKKT
ncbi:MAG: tetratricopeptide repeat protein [Candidatus Omnitrophica bacterium]|nr:tetratricopeptide repeat protein [Candidatus Omnitrophota bacterium]